MTGADAEQQDALAGVVDMNAEQVWDGWGAMQGQGSGVMGSWCVCQGEARGCRWGVDAGGGAVATGYQGVSLC